MEKIYLSEIDRHDGKEVMIEGWLYNKRSSGKINFLLVRDGTGIIQAVAVRAEMDEEQFNLIDELQQESSLRIWGKVRRDERSPGGWEMNLAQRGIHVPSQMPKVRRRLLRLISSTKSTELVVLGDVKHTIAKAGYSEWRDVHGAGCQRSDPMEGDPADYPYGHGPQGDAIRIYNYVRCVRDISQLDTLLGVTPDSLFFSGHTGGADPEPQWFQITEEIGLAVEFQVAESCPWSTLMPCHSISANTCTRGNSSSANRFHNCPLFS